MLVLGENFNNLMTMGNYKTSTPVTSPSATVIADDDDDDAQMTSLVDDVKPTTQKKTRKKRRSSRKSEDIAEEVAAEQIDKGLPFLIMSKDCIVVLFCLFL